LNRESSWQTLTNAGYEGAEQVTLDHVWVAVNFRKPELVGLEDLIQYSEEQLQVVSVTQRKTSKV
jgi:hypothetical protein